MKKEKLINLICEKFNLTEKQATGLILSGSVLVNEVPVYKTGALIDYNKTIRIKDSQKYVSRGAYKLLTAFRNFNIDISNKICIDIGSSTGGFTQVLLEKGALKVYAVDCGRNILDYSIRKDKRVISLEGTKYSDLSKELISDSIDFAVIDASFTSVVKIIEFLNKKLNINWIVALIKPQFEYKRLTAKLNLDSNFNGIVINENDRKLIIDEVCKEISALGLTVSDCIESDIKGTNGNLEYLAQIKSKNNIAF